MRSTTDNNGEYEQVLVMGQVIDPIDRKGGMRLNSAMKQEVVTKAMAHGFGKREEALKKEQLQLSKLFYIHAFGPTVLKQALALKDTPFVLVGKDRYGRKLGKGNDQSGPIHTRWNVGGQALDLEVDATMPLNVDNNVQRQFTIKDEALVARCRAWQDARETFNTEYAKTTGTLKGMLERITTYPSLEKNWPQGKPFYKHLPTAYPFRHQVPAVLISELNSTLGLA